MNFQWKAKEKPQPPTWADWFTNLHHRLTTWFGVFLLCLTGVPANVNHVVPVLLGVPKPHIPRRHLLLLVGNRQPRMALLHLVLHCRGVPVTFWAIATIGVVTATLIQYAIMRYEQQDALAPDSTATMRAARAALPAEHREWFDWTAQLAGFDDLAPTTVRKPDEPPKIIDYSITKVDWQQRRDHNPFAEAVAVSLGKRRQP